MNKKFKGFFNWNLRHDGGFTLVELIVVIAILAILAGVAIPAYSGYVEKTNRTADETLLAQVANALELQYYAGNLTGTSAVNVTDKGAAASDEFAAAAMEAAFGANWEDTVCLRSKSWGNTVGVTTEVLNHFTDGAANNSALQGIYAGTVSPSFAENVDTLFPLVKDTALAISGSLGGSGAQLVQGAATTTLTKDPTTFAQLWSSGAWNAVYSGGNYGADATGTAEQIADAAVIKARNTALAGYLQTELQLTDEQYNALMNYNYGNSSVPQDFVGQWTAITDGSEKAQLLQSVFGGTGLSVSKLNKAINGYYNGGESSEAYKDGLAYYAMMDTVSSVNGANQDDSTYWNEMTEAVHLYGQIATGNATTSSLSGMYGSLSVAGASVSTMVQIVPTETGYEVRK